MMKTLDLSNSTAAGRIRVVIIEDERLIREGLAALISGTSGYLCTGAYRSMEEALANPWSPPPNIVLLDIGLPGMSGIQGLRVLREKYPKIALLMLTVFDDDESIFAALCAGASGYLLKKTPPAKLLEGIRDAASGGATMSPEIALRVIQLFRGQRPPPESPDELTSHEVRLLKLLVEGHSYKTAAAELHVTVSTINFHIQNIYSKLHVHSKSEAVVKALQQRLLG
jgi:DNA-binding NarL/FixJ family response regulator